MFQCDLQECTHNLCLLSIVSMASLALMATIISSENIVQVINAANHQF